MTSGAAAPEPGVPQVLVSVTELRRRLGSRAPVHAAIEAVGLALPDVGVPEGADVTIDGELESIHDGVVLTATATVPWVGACRRCLREVAGTGEVEVREVFELRPVEGETWPLVSDHVDLGPLLRDTALLALPLAPLCEDDCVGPAPEAYPAVVEGDGDAPAPDAEPARDPRWSALDDLEL